MPMPIRNNSCSTYTKFSEILTFLTLLIRTRIWQMQILYQFSVIFHCMVWFIFTISLMILYLKRPNLTQLVFFKWSFNSTELKLLRKKCPNTDQKKLRIWTLFTQWAFSNSFVQQSSILDNYQISVRRKTFFSWTGSYIRLQIFHKIMRKGFWF